MSKTPKAEWKIYRIGNNHISMLELLMEKSCTSWGWQFIPLYTRFLHSRWCRISEQSTVWCSGSIFGDNFADSFWWFAGHVWVIAFIHVNVSKCRWCFIFRFDWNHFLVVAPCVWRVCVCILYICLCVYTYIHVQESLCMYVQNMYTVYIHIDMIYAGYTTKSIQCHCYFTVHKDIKVHTAPATMQGLQVRRSTGTFPGLLVVKYFDSLFSTKKTQVVFTW